MKLLYSILLMAFLLSFNDVCAQSTQKLFFAGENYVWQTQFYKDNGIPPMYMLYQHNFVSSNGLAIDKKLMEKWMDKIIPDKVTPGYGILDWEGYIYNVIAGWQSVSATTYKKYLNQFIAAIRYAKYLRPNIKWSIYFMPTYLYSQYAEGKVKSHDRRMALLKELDFLAPSLYQFYDYKTVSAGFVSQYIDANLKFSVELGLKLNKPVYCFVWHRYQPYVAGSGYANANMLIPVGTFSEAMTRMLNTKVFNKKIDGLIWWNCEDFLYENRYNDPILLNEYQNVTDISTYKKNVLLTYLGVLRSVLNQ